MKTALTVWFVVLLVVLGLWIAGAGAWVVCGRLDMLKQVAIGVVCFGVMRWCLGEVRATSDEGWEV